MKESKSAARAWPSKNCSRLTAGPSRPALLQNITPPGSSATRSHRLFLCFALKCGQERTRVRDGGWIWRKQKSGAALGLGSIQLVPGCATAPPWRSHPPSAWAPTEAAPRRGLNKQSTREVLLRGPCVLDGTRKGETSPKQGDLTLQNQSTVKAELPLRAPGLVHRAAGCGRGSEPRVRASAGFSRGMCERFFTSKRKSLLFLPHYWHNSTCRPVSRRSYKPERIVLCQFGEKKISFGTTEIRNGGGDAGGFQSSVWNAETRSFQILFLTKVVLQTQGCGKGKTFRGRRG